jgi:hypothetical protein
VKSIAFSRYGLRSPIMSLDFLLYGYSSLLWTPFFWTYVFVVTALSQCRYLQLQGPRHDLQSACPLCKICLPPSTKSVRMLVTAFSRKSLPLRHLPHLLSTLYSIICNAYCHFAIHSLHCVEQSNMWEISQRHRFSFNKKKNLFKGLQAARSAQHGAERQHQQTENPHTQHH